jgi:preprotein translocase subunit YajC
MFTNIAIAEEVPQEVESVVVVAEPTSSLQSLTQDSTLMNLAPLVLIFLIFYFLLIRPQVKKQKEQQALINSVKKGDKVIVAGGIIGTFVKEEEGEIVEVELSKDVKIKALKQTITSIINKSVAQVKKEEPKDVKKNSKKSK